MIKNMSVEERQLYVTGKTLGLTKEVEEAMQKELETQLKIKNAMGLTGDGIKVVNHLLGGALGNTTEILAKSRERIDELEREGELHDGIKGKMQGFAIQMSEAGRSIKKSLNDPLTYLKAGLEFDKQTTELEKGLALSKSEAVGLRNEMSIVAAKTGDNAISAVKVQKAFMTMNAQMGIASEAMMHMAADAAIMQEKIGLSDKALGGATKSSLILGKEMGDIKLDIIESTTQMRTQTGIALDYKDIMEKTLNVTGQVNVQLGSNPKLIAEAVAQAKALGMELSQVAKVGASLLEFETSIENELKAELLTGKELNLERARALALTGDYAELAKEVAEQVGSFTEFSQMNVLQQRELATAFGMSADEMSNMLIDQEAMGKTAKELRAEGKEDIAQRLEARDAQQEFADAVMKIKGIFVDLVGGPIGALLGILTTLLKPIGYIVESFTKLVSFDFKNMSALNVVVGAIAATLLLMRARVLAINALSAQALITEKGINIEKGLGLLKDKMSNRFNKMKVFFGAQALTTETSINTQKGLGLLKDKIAIGWHKMKVFFGLAEEGSLVRQNVLQTSSNRKGIFGLLRAAGKFVLGMFSAGAKAPFPLNLALPFILGGIAGAIAASMIAKFSKGDDVISGGYGKRTLFDQDSLSVTAFNDKDTIVAGTNLHKRDAAVSLPPVPVTEIAAAQMASPPPPPSASPPGGGIDYDRLANSMSNVQVRGGDVKFDTNAYRDPNAVDGQSQNMLQAAIKHG